MICGWATTYCISIECISSRSAVYTLIFFSEKVKLFWKPNVQRQGNTERETSSVRWFMPQRARSEPGSRHFVQVSHRMAETSTLELSSATFPKPLQESWTEVELLGRELGLASQLVALPTILQHLTFHSSTSFFYKINSLHFAEVRI